jgi:hypothetical protein
MRREYLLENDVEIFVGDSIQVRMRDGATVSGKVTEVTRFQITLAIDDAGRTRTVALSDIKEATYISPPKPKGIGSLDPTRQPVVVRVYPGKTQADVAQLFAEEAAFLALNGYLPVTQSWAAGEPGVGRVLALGTLGSVAMRPAGALTVAYAHNSARIIGAANA